MKGTIGIKIANGDFYPILEENSTVKKRLVLTTVHNGQKSVQIDLFRSVSQSMEDAQYMGSLMVENIKPRKRGEPSIEMIISSDEDGHITADACDLDAGADGKRQTLTVSHKTADFLGQESDFADFDLEGRPQTPASLYGRVETFHEEKRRSPWLILVFALIFVIIAIGLLWFFFYGDKDSNPFKDMLPFAQDKMGYEQTAPVTPPPPAEKIQPVDPPAPPPAVTPPPEEAPVIQAPVAPPPARPAAAERKRPPAPVSSYKVPAVIPKDGVAYRIRWGDTLWDISEAFYRNPWLYPRIARHNNIRNPDLIISGRTIRIPPKN
jgi:hypothetical protein